MGRSDPDGQQLSLEWPVLDGENRGGEEERGGANRGRDPRRRGEAACCPLPSCQGLGAPPRRDRGEERAGDGGLAWRRRGAGVWVEVKQKQRRPAVK